MIDAARFPVTILNNKWFHPSEPAPVWPSFGQWQLTSMVSGNYSRAA